MTFYAIEQIPLFVQFPLILRSEYVHLMIQTIVCLTQCVNAQVKGETQGTKKEAEKLALCSLHLVHSTNEFD